MPESLASSATSFTHRRLRADSTTSFTYFREQNEHPEFPDEVMREHDESFEYAEDFDDSEDTRSLSPMRRLSSGLSRRSVDDTLLRRPYPTETFTGKLESIGRSSQKIYIKAEDLTIVVAGFSTNPVGYTLYIMLCIVTSGVGFLILRWLPRWQVWLTGRSKPLRDCNWVVVEVRSPL